MSVEKSDEDNEPQKERKALIKLMLAGKKIFEGKLKMWYGEPIGDWVEFRGIRIALKRTHGDEFEGIVPEPEN